MFLTFTLHDDLMRQIGGFRYVASSRSQFHEIIVIQYLGIEN